MTPMVVCFYKFCYFDGSSFIYFIIIFIVVAAFHSVVYYCVVKPNSFVASELDTVYHAWM